jgi:hypothetical protein
MNNDTDVTVHFSCPHCLTVYRATQERTAVGCPGEYYCGKCGAPVHEWIGFYVFSNWNTVAKSVPNGRRLGRPSRLDQA